MIGLNLTMSNFEDETIVIKAGELEMKHSIVLENSKNVRLIVETKIKSLMVNKCEGLTLQVLSCVSGV